jgi:hypothetical protein
MDREGEGSDAAAKRCSLPMTPIRSTIVGGIALTTALTAHAQDNGFIALGTGYRSCGEYLQAVDSERKARPRNADIRHIYTMQYLDFGSYAEGFLSGANWASLIHQDPKYTKVGVSTKDDDFTGAMVWLENYCHQHPLDYYVSAVINLRATLAIREQQ